jgi:hypothetical protein
MVKTTPPKDVDKKDLIDQYNWAITRLDAIIVSNMSTNALLQAAIKDEAKILRKATVLMKKVLLHELL